MTRWIGLMVLVGCSGGGGDDTTDGEVGERVDAVLALEGDVTRGMPLYEGDCASCHGTYGEGVSGPQLLARELNHDSVVSLMIQGSGEMPGYAAWSDQELADVLAYVDAEIFNASSCRKAAEHSGDSGTTTDTTGC